MQAPMKADPRKTRVMKERVAAELGVPEFTSAEREVLALERVKSAREVLLQDEPLYGLVALQRKLRMTWSIPTAATDGKEVIFNPDFVLKHSEYDLCTFFIHEFWHILKGDHLRVKGKNFRVFNLASDMVINTQIIAQGERRTLPGGCLSSCAVIGKDTEEVYEEMIEELEEETRERKERQKKEEERSPEDSEDGNSSDDELSGEKEVGDESGDEEGEETGDAEGQGEISEEVMQKKEEGNVGIDVMEPKNEDGSEMTASDKKGQQEEVYREVRQAMDAASKTGTVKEAVKVAINKEMKPTRHPREVLTRFLQDATARSDYTFRRPNKRYLDAGFYLPSLQEESFSKICAMIDVSGSVSDGMIGDFCAEMREYLDGIGSDAELLIIYVDTIVTHTEILRKDDDFVLNPKRVTGGTRFAPGFKWLKDEGEDRLNGIVYYTDGRCSSFPKMDLEPSCPVLWILHHEYHTNVDRFEKDVPFGDVLVMPRRN